MSSPRTIAVGFIASIIVAGLAPAGAAFAASAASQASGVRLHGALTMQHGRRYERDSGFGSRLGLEALGVTGSYGYGDDYPSYGSSAYRGDSGPSRVASRGVLSEGRAAAVAIVRSVGRDAHAREWHQSPAEQVVQGSTDRRATSELQSL